jgi:hypothetical protein
MFYIGAIVVTHADVSEPRPEHTNRPVGGNRPYGRCGETTERDAVMRETVREWGKQCDTSFGVDTQ